MALENSKETSNEITIEEIQELDKDSYLIVDIRDEVEISHGAHPGCDGSPDGQADARESGGDSQ